jgi:AcrR family transcriptional regulator
MTPAMARIIDTSREKYKDEARKRIVSAAIRVMKKKGYAAMTVEDIAQEVGVTKAALYLYFTNKDEIMHSVIQESVSQFRTIAFSALDASDNIDTALQRMIDDSMQIYKTFGSIQDNMVFVLELYSLSSREPEKHELLKRTLDKNLRIVSDWIIALRDKALVPEDVDVRGTAIGVISLSAAAKFRLYDGENEDEVKRWWIVMTKKLLVNP